MKIANKLNINDKSANQIWYAGHHFSASDRENFALSYLDLLARYGRHNAHEILIAVEAVAGILNPEAEYSEEARLQAALKQIAQTDFAKQELSWLR